MASLETLGAYVARDIRNQVSGEVRALLGLHLTDTVTAWIATSATHEAQVLRKFQGEAKQSEADVGLDILINCALTRLSEIDDIHLASMITPGSIVIPGALAIAVPLPAPGVGHHNAPTGSRWFAAGSAARNGLVAAQAARCGVTSDLNLLEGSFFSAVFNILPKAGALIEALGASPKIAEVSFKPWC